MIRSNLTSRLLLPFLAICFSVFVNADQASAQTYIEVPVTEYGEETDPNLAVAIAESSYFAAATQIASAPPEGYVHERTTTPFTSLEFTGSGYRATSRGKVIFVDWLSSHDWGGWIIGF